MATLMLALQEESSDGELKWDGTPILYRKMEWEKPIAGEEFTLEIDVYEVAEVAHILRGDGSTPYILVVFRLADFQVEALMDDEKERAAHEDLRQLWFQSVERALL